MEHPPRFPAAAPPRRGLPPRRRPSSARRPAGGPRSAALALLVALANPWQAVAAEPLAPPSGEVLLVVTGDIALPNVGAEAHLDREHLMALPRARFMTDTPWAKDGPHAFEGVRLDALFAAVGARGTRFEALGIDDYAATFEGVDLERYPVIVADTLDGKPLTVRTLGPLRILFPFDDHPELLTETSMAISVWQLVAMDVR